jgi:DNA anti-recombination protein RmuC
MEEKKTKQELLKELQEVADKYQKLYDTLWEMAETMAKMQGDLNKLQEDYDSMVKKIKNKSYFQNHSNTSAIQVSVRCIAYKSNKAIAQ